MSTERVRVPMLPHHEFGRLRLRDFVPADDVVDLRGWEFRDETWVGEAVGFTEWLRREDEPDVLRALSLDFEEVSDGAAQAVMGRLGLPLRMGLSRDELVQRLGAPRAEARYRPDRATMEFSCGDPDPYVLSCALDGEEGLVFLAVLACVPARAGARERREER